MLSSNPADLHFSSSNRESSKLMSVVRLRLRLPIKLMGFTATVSRIRQASLRGKRGGAGCRRKTFGGGGLEERLEVVQGYKHIMKDRIRLPTAFLPSPWSESARGE